MSKVVISLANDEKITAECGTFLEEILPKEINGLPVIAALVNNDLMPLKVPVLTNMTVCPITLADEHGWQVYRRTLSFLLAKALHETFPGVRYRVRNNFGSNALYWTIDWPVDISNDLFIAKVRATMARMIHEDMPIETQILGYEEILTLLQKNGQDDKVNLLTHRNPPFLALVRCGTFYDLPQGVLAPSAGVIKLFDLIPHAYGFILQFPSSVRPNEIDPLPPYDYLFKIYEEHDKWGEILDIKNAGQLNQVIANHGINDVINTVEALHEKKLSEIADSISTANPRPHVVLIAGPSSAGKTTTAMRLCTHLRVIGLKPTLLSTDNYFLGAGKEPLDADGKADYEHIDAMDRQRLNADILALLAGKTIPMRSYDFIKHCGFDRTDKSLFLPPNGVLVIEGIHSLNPQLTVQIPRTEKFLIFVSALTQLAIDRNNRISTTDNRLLRRLVRDNLFRGKSPLETLRLWSSVRRGEERWIFPFQQLADAVFNSSLDYEIPILKTLVTPLLNEVKPSHAEYAIARRLTCFLQNFTALPYENTPTNSILREYLGDSRLVYE